MENEQPTEGDGEAENGFQSLGEIALRVSGKILARAGKRHAGKPPVVAANFNDDTGGASEFERRAPWVE